MYFKNSQMMNLLLLLTAGGSHKVQQHRSAPLWHTGRNCWICEIRRPPTKKLTNRSVGETGIKVIWLAQRFSTLLLKYSMTKYRLLKVTRAIRPDALYHFGYFCPNTVVLCVTEFTDMRGYPKRFVNSSEE